MNENDDLDEKIEKNVILQANYSELMSNITV